MARRYFGFDVHKDFIMAAAVDAEQNIVLKPRRISATGFEKWVMKNVAKEDEAVIEAMSGCWVTHDMLKKYCQRVVVAHPYHVKLIASSFVKTDKRDAIALARLLAANILPEVWVPPPHVRELRGLIRHRETLVQKRATAKTRIRAVMHRYQILGPKGISAFEQSYWDTVDIPATEKLRVRHSIDTIQLLTCQVKEAEKELTRLSATPHWAKDVPHLLQLPGIGLITAMTILSAVGTIKRFPTAKKLVGYAGLGARVYSSGQSHKSGGITKQGRRELRYVMVEAAWNAIKNSELWRERFERLAHRLGRQKAAVAIARKLLVVVWNVLTYQSADRYAEPNTVAKSMFLWSQRNRLATSLGLKPAEFTSQKLNQLGFEMKQFQYCSKTYVLPPP
jgi:transposase